MTDPNLVPEFIEKTGVDALAISIGTVHGYFTGKSEINFKLLQKINDCAKVPLVLHGGTGLKDEEFLRAISLGIRKINYGTDIFGTSTIAARKILKENPDLLMFQDVCLEVRNAVRNRVAYLIQLWGSTGKAW
jgi:fructose/tagatose bisphosphate aldolase